MDEKNNYSGSGGENFSRPASDAPVYHQGKYPEPPEWTKNIVISDKPWIPEGEEGNVSVQFNEPEKIAVSEVTDGKTSPEPSDKKEWPTWIQIGLIVLVAVVAFLLAKSVMSARSGAVEPTTVPAGTSVTVYPTQSVIPTTVPVQTTNADSEDKTSIPVSEESTTAKVEKPTEKDDKNPSSQSTDKKQDEETKAQIIEYFNQSSNRVKTEAVKVVKNFEKRTLNEDKLEMPSAIKGVAKSILADKITDITEPVEYTEPDEIDVRYPAPNARWSSKLTPDDVESAVCTENGNEYEITLVLKTCIDPEPAKGTSKAMDCLDVPSVRESAPSFITKFSAEYYDCTIRCRVDKETGRVVWSNYTTPVVIKVGLDAGFVAFDAEIGLTFEKDYTVIY